MRKLLRLVSVLICMALCLHLVVFEAAAEEIPSGYCGGEGDGTNLSWVLTDDEVLTICGSGKMEDYYYYQSSPFTQCQDRIKSVVLKHGVTSISNYAFYNCQNLTAVTIPDSVTSIGDDAFRTCGLTTVTIPNSVTSISYGAFSGCTNLTDIYCEAENKPDGWDYDLNSNSNATIHWGYKPILYGDLNGDGVVNEYEIRIILDTVKKINTMTDEQFGITDYNKDGTIDIRDFNYIYNQTYNK